MNRVLRMLACVCAILAPAIGLAQPAAATAQEPRSGAANAAQAAGAEPVQERALTRDQFARLPAGGFVLYMRHGKTDATRADQFPVDFADCATQRQLSDEGRRATASIGQSIRRARIPVGDIFVSPMCRTRESAELVFGKATKFTVLEALFSSTNQTSAQKRPTIEATRRLLSEPVAAGTNRFVLAHAPNLDDAMGYFPKAEGTLVVFEPSPSGFTYLGSIRPDQWPALLR